MHLPAAEGTLRAIVRHARGGDALIAECAGVRDWPALLALAREQGVLGVVRAAVRRTDVSLPTNALTNAERQLLVEEMRQDVMRRTLADVLERLADRGIANASLKGPLLAARLYPPGEVRPSTDLDILVDPSTVATAADALAALGYALEGGPRGRFFRDHHHHVHLAHPTLPTIELHVEAYRGFGTSLPAAPLLARRVACEEPGFTGACVLSPEDEWIYLAVHGASHRFERLSWLYDLLLLNAAQPAMQWDLVASRASEWKVEAVVALATKLLHEWLGADVSPNGPLVPLGDGRWRAVRHLLSRRELHLADAAASVAFAALLCDRRTALAFGARYLRVKVLHEMPLRARTRFAS